MSDCRFGVSPVNYPDPDPESLSGWGIGGGGGGDPPTNKRSVMHCGSVMDSFLVFFSTSKIVYAHVDKNR